jgi:hydrogenase maturation factor
MKKLKGIIDRFEGNIAVIEMDGVTKDIEKALFPKEATVGDVVEIEGNNVKVLKNETEKLMKEIEDLMNDVWED